mmetsp:Transcript_1085/g.2251  ORF Transcript_1085/g.2251 Transcript_1085/m.2251 type:complete len:105 (+) Transcript_1085:466-780(+)|eukprot:CAMPEP_0172315558 /NCGR_PEP_ID=MMETSP1058-20130122/25532_1 /TAXON_ID=83371 /ORGANISM="Detonula confervacea, Strain CCMP 353" /LENGTH=104 /DNA_ID=CAMNT_0013029649 /DNA_START=385 /DNA_END=699 /DNA_ORIENTATION=+
MVNSIITVATTITLLLIGARHHRADAQAVQGPNDRFTEGTKIHSLFNEIDINGDKKLDKQEVHLYFQKQGVPVQDGLWEKEDKNGDGVIELHEFARGGDDEGEL